MDNQNPNENKTPFSDNINKAEWRGKTYDEILAELNNDPEVQLLKENYNSSSVDRFIKEYARTKVNILEWGPKKEEWSENDETQWNDSAYEALIQIQQKKLFDLQCLWRAGNIDIKEILISNDFNTWEHDVMNCPFVPPVTRQEIDLYIQYLLSNNYEDEAEVSMVRWQNYDDMKDAYNNDDADVNFPEWYDFYNSRMGTGVYLTFPDIRGDQEHFYRKLSHEYDSVVKLAEKQQTPPSSAEQRLPMLWSSDKAQLKWFVYTFEDKETQELAELSNAFMDIDDYDFNWENDKDLLLSLTEPVPVLPWYNWREALHRAANMYKRNKIVQAMPLAYESYCIRREAGIPFETNSHDDSWKDIKKDVRQIIIDQIIEGRVLNGEPPDLNF